MYDKHIIIMIGLPGSGKSSYIKKHIDYDFIISADHYFDIMHGPNIKYNYFYNPSYIYSAHQRCRFLFRELMQLDKELTIVIDNTNLSWKDIKEYYQELKGINWDLTIIDLYNEDITNEELANRNKHGVSISVIQQMREKYKNNIENIKTICEKEDFNYINIKEQLSWDKQLHSLFQKFQHNFLSLLKTI